METTEINGIQYLSIKLHKSQVPYPIKNNYVTQVHDVTIETFDEEVGLGAYTIIKTIEE